MKPRLVALFILVSLLQVAYSLAIQAQANPPGPGEPGYKPGSGTTICIDVPRALDAKKLKADEEIVGRVTQDLVYEGKVRLDHLVPDLLGTHRHLTLQPHLDQSALELAHPGTPIF